MQENYLEAALKQMPVEAGIGDVIRYSGVVKQVLAGLLEQGIVVGNWLDVLKVTLMIVDLVQEIGPKVAEIIEAVKKAFNW